MKVAWVTPFSQRSAIGRVSSAVTRELAKKNHEILIVRSEHDRDDATPPHATALPMTWWHDISPQDIDLQHDVIILNFGDSYNFHAGVLPFTNKLRCLGIFHDYYLYNFFNRYLVHNALDEAVHEREICATYGESVLQLARQAWRNDARVEEIAQLLPMTEWLGRRCGAALAHARFYLSRLENSCPGPSAVTPLCFEGRQVSPLPIRRQDHVTITTVGIINPNKCVDAIIRSIASSPALRKACRFRAVGAITPRERSRLQKLCRDAGFEHVAFLGEVDDAELAAELGRADIISCLRQPVLEGCSASAIEGMLCGRPIVVADAGFYAELPADLVTKIPSSVEVEPLRQALERLVADENLRREIGCKAQAWASRTFTVQAYVAVLEDLMEQFVAVKPFLGVGGRIGRELASLGMRPTDPGISDLAAKMNELFGATA
jgi:glycosyltransferase involved in cell wall biosynthesis